MAVDKNLFLYDLAIVAIMKNEAPYVKEWLDYHLLAGVDHFYLYDNESTDNIDEVLKPYVENGVVTKINYPGKMAMHASRNEAIQKYRFSCRYIAFLDLDEFIYPQNNRSIIEVVDEVLSKNPSAAALSIHWHLFGTSYHNTADYTRGVLERFKHRAENDHAPIDSHGLPTGNSFVKTIVNPRYVDYSSDAHNANYYLGRYAVDETGKYFPISVGLPVVTNKIIVNHYNLKSREELEKRVSNGYPDQYSRGYDFNNFTHRHPFNAVYDDSILDYVKARRGALQQQGGGVCFKH